MHKRVVNIADLHCGHRAGMTPPGWRYPTDSRDTEIIKFVNEQQIMWDFYTERVEALKPIDVLFVNGDSIDGKGRRSGGTEQIYTDRQKQAEMAAECINIWEAPIIIMTYGTPAHTGEDEDWEDTVAAKVHANKIGGHEWVEVNGVIFDIKHKTSSSTIPHGRYTGPKRAALWNTIWADIGAQPRAQVFLRNHVHYYGFSGDSRELVMTCPALQGFGSKYGTRQCEGVVDIGFVHFDVEEDGNYSWTPHLLDLKLLAPTVVHA